MPKYEAYVVTRGRQVGVFNDWLSTKPHVVGVSDSVYQGAKTLEEAESKFARQLHSGMVQILHPDGRRIPVGPSDFQNHHTSGPPGPPPHSMSSSVAAAAPNSAVHGEFQNTSSAQQAIADVSQWAPSSSASGGSCQCQCSNSQQNLSQSTLAPKLEPKVTGSAANAPTASSQPSPPRTTYAGSPRIVLRRTVTYANQETQTWKSPSGIYRSRSGSISTPSSSSSPPTGVTQREPLTLSPTGLDLSIHDEPDSAMEEQRFTSRRRTQSYAGPRGSPLSQRNSPKTPGNSSTPSRSILGLSFSPGSAVPPLPASPSACPVDPRSPYRKHQTIPSFPVFPRASPSGKSSRGEVSSSFQRMVLH